MNRLIEELSSQILGQLQPKQTNIIRIESFDNPIVYYSVCKILRDSVDLLIAKLTKEKYCEFVAANNPEWLLALRFLHQGSNSVYSAELDTEYANKSYVDFNNAITKWRNESANISEGKTSLILLMGTEAATDIGGLADTSFVISPKEIIASLANDYSRWFTQILDSCNINSEECRVSIHTLYRTLFSSINVNLFRLSHFIDKLSTVALGTPQELIDYICETLSTTWKVPSVINSRQVPKVQALSKGKQTSAKVITNAVNFIKRVDDIPSEKKVETYRDQFAKYAEKNGIDTSLPFPSDTQLYPSFDSFRDCVIEYMCGKNIANNRALLLKTDYAIIADILDTKIIKPIVEQAVTISGEPVEAFAKIFLDTTGRFYDEKKIFPKSFSVSVYRILLSNCVEEQKEDAYRPISSFLGGILGFYSEASIACDGELITYSFENDEDPFDFSNYNAIKDRIRCTGKWGDPCKIQMYVTLSNGSIVKKYEYKWVFSPYCPWPNAFHYLGNALFSNDDSYSLPTLSVCKNIQNYLGCESEDEFYAQLDQLECTVLFDDHRSLIHKYFAETPISGLFDLVCSNFKDFALQITEHGLFNALIQLRTLVSSYTDLMSKLASGYRNFTDVQREKVPLLLNCFMLTSNQDVISSCNMGEVIVPAYNPVMLEKIDAKQLFIRTGFAELMNDKLSGRVVKNESISVTTFTQMASITQSVDTVLRKATEYLTCRNMWEYFGVYYNEHSEGELLSGNSFGLSVVTDDEDASAMLRATPMSSIIVRNVMDYIHTFPARIDGLNISFIAPSDMQHIVSAIHSIAKRMEDAEMTATINVGIICLNSRKNSSAYLRKWLDSYFEEERSVKVNTYLQNIIIKEASDVENIKHLMKNCDVCFTYDMLSNTGVHFGISGDADFDINQAKFPMTFTPDTIATTSGKSRKLNISQFQFLASKYHTQASHIAGSPYSEPGVYRAYEVLELQDRQEQIIEMAHNCCRWVVCIDPAIDRSMLEKNNSKIIGFTTGEGCYGELNVTVSARNDVLKDIKSMLKKRITERFKSWDSERLQKATDFCVDTLSQYMDGSRILKSLNPYDYEIHNYLAYILSIQMLKLTQTDSSKAVRSLISLDSYKHWFVDDIDNTRPDFMLLEIPLSDDNLNPETNLHIDIKVIECKMGFQNDSHIAKAKSQLEKGLRTMIAKWEQDSAGIMHRYWLNQLYRAIIFSPLNLMDTSNEYQIIRNKIYNILADKVEFSWSGDIFTFWLDSNAEVPDEYTIDSDVISDFALHGVAVTDMVCHCCGQMYIQKMLLPPEERDKDFVYNVIIPNVDDDEEGEPDNSQSGTNESGTTIPSQNEVYIPFLTYLDGKSETNRQESLLWFGTWFKINQKDKNIVFESNGHPKWETILDSTITKVRQDGVIENSAVGSFHLTDLGRRVFEYLQEHGDKGYHDALVAMRDFVQKNPESDPSSLTPEKEHTIPIALDEAIILLDCLLSEKKLNTSRSETAEKASKILRAFALKNNQPITESFRSPAGLMGRFNSLYTAFYEGKTSSPETTKVFVEVCEMFKNNESAFRKRLQEILMLIGNENPENETKSRLSPKPLSEVRLLLGKDMRNNEPYYWEFGNKELNNRHLLINGNSGCGKTYCIQTLLMEAALQGVSAVVFDYTGGFANSKLDPVFKEKLGDKVEQRIVKVKKIPVNPFEKHDIQIDDDIFVPEENADVADKIAEIFKSVYSFGDQQRGVVYSAVLNGLEKHGDAMSFPAMVEELETIGSSYAKNVLNKIRTFIDFNPFTIEESFNWSDIRDSKGKVYVFQLVGYGREIQVLLTELLLWDIWSFCVKNGDESKPFVIVLDEAQNLSHGEKSPSAKILTEGRKFGLSGWYATQFMKPQLSDDEIQRLQQAGQKLYFCPPDDGVLTVAKNIDISTQGSKEWSEKLKKLKKGECVTCGSMIRNGRWGKYEPRLIKVTSLQERLEND